VAVIVVTEYSVLESENHGPSPSLSAKFWANPKPF
jgi:hypothetical protein